MVRFLPALFLGLLLLLAGPAQADVLDDGGVFEGAALLAAPDVPDEFVEEEVFDDLIAPASIAFSPDGRVFVGQLDGQIVVFDSLEDATPSVYADLSENVAFHNDRGLLGMVLDPQFTTGRPYVYALYTYDAAIGQQAPRWNDNCTDPPGAERDGCVVSGRLSKILPNGDEVPLIQDEWCQQYPSHSVGDLQFGPDGALYATAGDGASYTFADYGQDGAPVNPCGDHPRPVGGAQTAPTAEGGALRSQDPRTTGDPTGLDGALIRVDPDTGDPLPTNPGTGDVNARRIVAYGFRNPFRFAFRPGTTEAYVGDVGWLAWEELNRVPDTTSQVRNYGWPCYEGGGRQGGYDALGLNICEDLYDDASALPPLYTYNHSAKVAAESCPIGSSSVSGVEFYSGGTFPPAYQGAMFFADYSRGCIWVMFPGPDGTPNPATRQVFVDEAATPVDIEMGPGGDLYYADVGGGTIRRVRAINPNQAPTAAFTATPEAGATPLEVHFDAGGSSDPNDDALTYEWDLDGDGAFDDATGVTPSRTYTQEGHVNVRLRVRDPGGLADTEQREITAGTPPVPVISAPTGGTTYAVGDTVSFAGSADVPASQLRWTVDLNHCSAIVPTSCHVHHIQDFAGVESGSFVYPDHEYPSYLSLGLTATKTSGLRGTTSVRLDPKTVELRFESDPPGLRLAVGGEQSTTPFTRSVAQNSTVGVAAPPSQFLGVDSYDFTSWSDGGAAAHQFTAPSAATTYRATYARTVCPVFPGLVGAWAFDEASGNAVLDGSGAGNGGTNSGATRVADGRFGRALEFDGGADLVTIPDSNSLDLVSGMTLEAWVNPAALGSTWRTVLLKEQPGNLAYALYANDGDGHWTGHAAIPFDARASAPALAVNQWTHVAATFDGSTLRLYANGVQVANELAFGSITTSNGALRIGGNNVWPEFFAGRIDEVRVYNRPLTANEVAADMTRAINCAGVPGAPSLSVTPAALTFSGPNPAAKTLDIANTGEGTLSWTASDDAPWLSVAPGSGTGAGTITVTPDTTGLAPGTHTANVTISAAGATGSPRTVPVTLTVDAGPALGVAPGSLSFGGTQGGASPADRTLTISNTGGGTLSWSVSDDAPWLSVAPASGTGGGDVTVSASIAGLSAGTHTANVTVTAPGATGSPRTIPVTFTVDPPPQPPQLAVSPAALTFSATAGAPTVETKAFTVTNAGGGTLDFTASADVPWLNVSPGSGSAPRTVSVTPTTAGLAAGVHTGKVTVTSPGVSGSPKTVDVTFTVADAPACPAPAGLVGAWAFDETSGNAVTDASSAGNGGTISGATRTTAGRFGGALTFDGSNDLVTVSDAPSLRLTTGMTASAWVNPTALGGTWRTVLFKERAGGLSYTLYANTEGGLPGGHVSTPMEQNARATAAIASGVWTHLATTYDGTTLRLFVNGVQVSSRAVSGAILNDAGALRIGGNNVWPEWFAGRIDEVRLYNRALPAGEIQADMAAPVTCSGPTLTVTPSSLSFSGVAGGADPAAKTLTVASGSASWTASETAPWLSLATAGGTITATAQLGSLAAGTYTTDITVTAPGATGSPKTIPVTFTVDPQPNLTVAPASLSFSGVQGGADPASKTLSVTNTGGGSLSFSVSDDAPWLSVSPGSGSAPATLTVNPSTAGLTQGTHTAVVTVTAAGALGSPRTVSVTLTVDPPPPTLTVTPGSLSFSAVQGGASPAAKTLTVGAGALAWTASESVSWLSLSTAGNEITVTPSVTGLTAGTYTTDVTVSAPGAIGTPKTVPVTFTVDPPSPVLSVAPASLSFSGGQGGPDPVSKTVSVTNTGGGSLSFSVSDDASWLSVSPGSGSAPATLTVTASTSGLTQGTYTGEVTVTAPGVSGSPKTVSVTLTVDPPPPTLTVTPGSLSFSAVQGGSSPAAKTLTVGAGALAWTASESVGWLSLSTAGNEVTVTPSVTGLTAGTYTTDVTVSAPGAIGSPKTVPVTFTVDPPPPVLAVAPSSLTFSGVQGGTDPASKTVSVTNTGGGSLSFTVSDDAPWLSISPGSGSAPQTLTVSASTAGLTPGSYTGDVTVTAPGVSGSPKTVSVTLTVDPPPPTLTVTPGSLSFSAVQGGLSPAAKTLTVGAGALAWTASESVSWLSLSTAGNEVTVTPSVTGLTAGTYTTDVTVSAPGAIGSPKTVPVTFTVDPPPPALAVSPSSLTFTATAGGANPASKDVSVTNTGGGSLSFSVSDDAPWLSVSPGSGSAPATLAVAPSITGLAQGTYTATVTVTAAGVAGSPRTVGVTLTVDPAPPTIPPGLVAAYGFEEPSGTAVNDASGRGHNGTLSGATRSTSGRFGSALSFDGVNDWVTVPDHNELDLTTGVTMSAWVNPTALGSVYRTVLMKEQPGGLIYTLYAGDGTGKPSGHVFTTSEQRATGPTNTPVNAWTHLASTYDGTTLRTYVNGTQVASRALTGLLRTSTGVLRIGGTSVWPEWFAGRIDDVRLYSRALTPTEIQGDMARAAP